MPTAILKMDAMGYWTLYSGHQPVISFSTYDEALEFISEEGPWDGGLVRIEREPFDLSADQARYNEQENRADELRSALLDIARTGVPS